LQLLLQLFPRTRAIKWTIFQGALSLVLFLFGIVFWRWDVSLFSSMLKTAVVAMLVIVSLVLGLHSLTILARHDDKNYVGLRQVLGKQMASIVWVYEMPMKVLPDGPVSEIDKATIYIWLQEGVVHSFSLSREQIRPLFTFLRPRLPQATFGYNLKLAQIYQEPEQLPVHHG